MKTFTVSHWEKNLGGNINFAAGEKNPVLNIDLIFVCKGFLKTVIRKGVLI